jgi:release factor glutamine methyltransferase
MTEDEWMLTSIFNCRRVDLAARRHVLTPRQQSAYEGMRRRRTRGEPLQYIIGETSFMGIPLKVDPRVLIPRPETELLVECAVEKMERLPRREGLRILDLGTGSGNIAIALAEHLPGAAITALDISREALTLAAENARANAAARTIQFLNREMSDYLQDAAGQGLLYNMVISNPPYIPTGRISELPADVRREPAMALDGGEDGLDHYRKIIHYAHLVMKPEGFLLLEIGDGQRDGIESIFQQYPEYDRLNFQKDYVGTDRIIWVRLWKN